MKGSARSSTVLCAALALGACVNADALGLENYTFSDVRGEPRTFACTPGQDSGARAEASMAILNTEFQQMEQDIRTRTEARRNGGPAFGASQLIQLSQQTGLRVARRIEAENGCYLQD